MEAGTVLAIETALAKGSMDRVERREPEKVYHKLSQQDWQAPGAFVFLRYVRIGASKRPHSLP